MAQVGHALGGVAADLVDWIAGQGDEGGDGIRASDQAEGDAEPEGGEADEQGGGGGGSAAQVQKLDGQGHQSALCAAQPAGGADDSPQHGADAEDEDGDQHGSAARLDAHAQDDQIIGQSFA